MVIFAGPMPSPGISGTTSAEDFKAQYGGSSPTSPTGPVGPMGFDSSEPLVYLGTRSAAYGDAFAGDDNKITKTGYGAFKSAYDYDKVAPLSVAIRKFDNMNMAKQRRMLRLLALGGFAGAIPVEDIDEAVSEASQQDARAAYMSLLETASQYAQQGITPTETLRSAIAFRLQGMGVGWNGKFSVFDNGISKSKLKALDDGEGVGGTAPDSIEFGGQLITKPGTYSETQTSSDFLNPKDAKALTRAMLQAELGRDPTQAEYEDFLSAINAAEEDNPATQTTTIDVTREGGQLLVDDQRTRTDTGIGAEGLGQVAYEKARRQPGWAEWQAMGTYAPALFQALGAAVPGA